MLCKKLPKIGFLGLQGGAETKGTLICEKVDKAT